MCNEFLNFFDQKTQDWPMHLDISYSKMCDWTILVTKRGCAKGYPECVCGQLPTVISLRNGRGL